MPSTSFVLAAWCCLRRPTSPPRCPGKCHLVGEGPRPQLCSPRMPATRTAGFPSRPRKQPAGGRSRSWKRQARAFHSREESVSAAAPCAWNGAAALTPSSGDTCRACSLRILPADTQRKTFGLRPNPSISFSLSFARARKREAASSLLTGSLCSAPRGLTAQRLSDTRPEPVTQPHPSWQVAKRPGPGGPRVDCRTTGPKHRRSFCDRGPSSLSAWPLSRLIHFPAGGRRAGCRSRRSSAV